MILYFALLTLLLQQPVARATGCEDTEPSFQPRYTEQRKLAHFSVSSDQRGEFSVFSQAVQRFTTACQGPPVDAKATRSPDLVELVKLDPTIRLDIRYAGANNFVGQPVYKEPRAFLQRPAAEGLVAAHRELARHGYGLLIHDGYRPWSVTKLFWEVTPPALREFVADPATGSKHNRGAAVDLSMYDLATGTAVQMPSDYDEFSKRAYPDYRGGAPDARGRRDLLREVMERHGFTVEPNEWWHFNYNGWREYPILDIAFSSIR